MTSAHDLALSEESEEHHSGPVAGLALAALGVVFGDIGTSPLYSLTEVFSVGDHAIKPTPDNVYGVVSLAFWSIMLIVSGKYLFLVMRADNEGEGGILALVALLKRKLTGRPKFVGLAVILGIIGASLFYGDSLITPAISVMSAIEGLEVVNPSMSSLVVPLALTIITLLFLIQHRGTASVGRAFGPVMCLWFLTLAALGIPHIVANPSIFRALSPTYAITFLVTQPGIAFLALGAVVLTITGCEALYADMGHFGKKAIRSAWAALVLPCLTCCYLGMGALILDDPSAAEGPFFRMAPDWARVPVVILATLATVIASQAVISGAFSVSQQAARLGLLPRLDVRHTSKEESGQIYIPNINWILMVGVLGLVVAFRSSAALGSAYGLAVTGTLMLESFLFLCLAILVWHVSWWKIAAYVILISLAEVTFFAANIAKVMHGGWLPLLIAAIVITIMTTWRKGSQVVAQRRREIEGPLDDFLTLLQSGEIPRTPGLAVFPHPDAQTCPLALRQNLEFNGVVHEQIAIVSVVTENVPHIRHVDRASVSDLGYADDGLVHVTYRVGFNDSQDVPKALLWAMSKTDEVDLDPDRAHYFLSSLRVTRDGRARLHNWRTSLYLWLTGLAANRTSVFSLPPEQTVIMAGQLAIKSINEDDVEAAEAPIPLGHPGV